MDTQPYWHNYLQFNTLATGRASSADNPPPLGTEQFDKVFKNPRPINLY